MIMAIANKKIKMTFLMIAFSTQFSLLPNKENQKPDSQSIIASIFSYVIQKIYSNHRFFCPLCILNPNRIEDQLTQAIIKNDTETIAFLIEQRGAHPDAILFDEKRSSLQTPLSLAAENCVLGSLKTLLQLGADVNKQITFNATKYPTPLIESCAHKNLDRQNVAKVVKLLLLYGANPTIETDCYSGIHPLSCHERNLSTLQQEEKKEQPPKTAFDLARENNYTKAATYLESRRKTLSNNKALRLTSNKALRLR